MSVARFIADQRTMHRVPHAVTLRAPGCEPVVVLQVDQPPAHDRGRRVGAELDTAVKDAFDASGGHLWFAAHPRRPASRPAGRSA